LEENAGQRLKEQYGCLHIALWRDLDLILSIPFGNGIFCHAGDWDCWQGGCDFDILEAG
jgi:hypothetical protein